MIIINQGLPVNTESFYKCLGNSLRLRCLLLLLDRDELCVCDLVSVLNCSQPMISRHLAQLRASRLVSDRREGQWVYYRLHDELPDWQREILTATRRGLSAESPFADDATELASVRSCC